MNIALCDDEQRFRDFLEKHLRNYYNERSISLNFFHFSDGEEILKNDILFDLVFLDVEMGDINGIDSGKELKKKNPHCIIIVITAYEKYLDDAFSIQAFRFLSKPLNIVRLYKTLDNVSELIKNDIVVFYDMIKKQNVRIYTNDIIYVEVQRKKVIIVTTNGTYISKEKFEVWKNKLNGISFVYPHSSYIVNLDYAISHTRKQLVLAKKDVKGGIEEKYEIAIAPKKQAEIKQAFFYVLERR